MLSYIYAYLTIGVGSLIIIYTSHLLSKEKTLRQRADELLEALDPRRKTISYRIINFIAPLMAAVLVVIAWPIAIYMKVSDIRKAKELKMEDTLKEENSKFKIKHSDLIEELTIAEVESREIVYDPLDSVSQAPFGHLNQNWLNFIISASPNYSIWSFSSEWISEWGVTKTLSGYVLVYNSEIGPYFLTSTESNDD